MGCGPEDKSKGCKVPGAHMAVGYWGHDIYLQIQNEQKIERERALLEDQILAQSFRASFWQGAGNEELLADFSNNNAVQGDFTGQLNVDDHVKCACYKKSNTSADRKCGACYGVGIVPGYYKFGYDTLFMSIVDSDVTLTNLRRTRFKSSKVELVEGATTGTIESGDKPFNRVAFGSAWEQQALYYLREDTASSVVVEYSVNSGTSWSDISTLPTTNPYGSGTIRFRATLSRDDANVLSPFFEIVRARYATIPLENERPEGGYQKGPWLLIMRGPPQTGFKKQDYGSIPVEDGLTLWTAGLALFDPSIEVGSREELIIGPDAMFEILDGARVGSRYLTSNWQNSDPFGEIIVSHNFQIRIVDPVGPLARIW